MDTDAPLLDWRGQEIKVGTRVLWRNAGWGIGVVTAIREEKFSRVPLLDILWEERFWDQDRIGKTGHGIRPYHLTVWPVESSSMIFSGKSDD